MKLNPLKRSDKTPIALKTKTKNCCGTQGGRKNCESLEVRHCKPGVLLLGAWRAPHLTELRLAVVRTSVRGKAVAHVRSGSTAAHVRHVRT